MLIRLAAAASACGIAAGVIASVLALPAFPPAAMPDIHLHVVRASADVAAVGVLGGLCAYLVAFAIARRMARPATAQIAGVAFLLLASSSMLASLRAGAPLRELVREWVSPTPILDPVLVRYAFAPAMEWLRATRLLLVVIAVAAPVMAVVLPRLARWVLGGSATPRVPGALFAAFLLVQILPELWRTESPVVLLVVDSLRADHLGCYGYARPTSPNIDRFARDSIVFRQAISQGTFTKTSVASLLTSRYPYQHGVYRGVRASARRRSVEDVLREEETTLAEVLRREGFLAAAWVRNPHLSRTSGLSQGFFEYHDRPGGIARANQRVGGWIEGIGRRRRFFAYLHYLELHGPYRPKPPWDQMFREGGAATDLGDWRSLLKAIRRGERRLGDAERGQVVADYDGQLAFVDAEIGKLLEWLKRSGLYDRALVILTSDHGDAFLEHGFLAHNDTAYDELVRVPLIVKLPGAANAGKSVNRQVRLIDVYPTVLDVVGIGNAPKIEGRTLLELARGDDHASDRIAYSEWVAGRRGPAVAIRSEEFKYIRFWGGREELYDLRRDPGERVNVIDADGNRRAEFRRIVDRISRERRQSLERTRLLTRREKAELETLGYVGN